MAWHALTGYKHRKQLANIFANGWSYLFGRKTSVAFTGMEGVGKTVLFDHLSGRAFVEGYKPPMRSEKAESGSVTTTEKRLVLQVIPGTRDSQPRLESLNKIFRESKPVDGVIHVVANGFASTRNHDTIQALLVREKLNTIPKYRSFRLNSEMNDLEETCQAIREAHHKHRRPTWLIVAIDKVDLYQDSVLKVRSYYSPEGDSCFSQRLRLLQTQVGSDNFRWKAVPVCTWLEQFAWHKQVVGSQVTAEMRNGYFAQFRDELQNTCE